MASAVLGRSILELFDAEAVQSYAAVEMLSEDGMGEARRRQTATHGIVAVIDRAKFAQALRVALMPVAESRGVFGADCMMYASVGAEALRQVGVPARLQAGDALWRLGPGDADMIHHVAGAGTPTFGPAHVATEVFHAWIRVDAQVNAPAQLVDFTTWQLRDKARLLDLADGRHTNVEFCPDYLWVSEKMAASLTMRQVVNSSMAGVYTYTARPRVEGLRLPSPAAVRMVADVVLFCYDELLAGRSVAAEILPRT